jgi:hypothetical protein
MSAIYIVAGWCPRHESEMAMIIPTLDEDQTILQLLTDLRVADTLNWDEITIIHDNSIREQKRR